jgi:hypothetical protein
VADIALNNVPPEALISAQHEIARSIRDKDEAVSRHRLLIKRLKKSGLPTDALIEAHQLGQLPPEERRQRFIDRVRIEAVRYPDSGEILLEKLNTLDVRVSERARYADHLFAAEDAGYKSGRQGASADGNPHPSGSDMYAAWERYRQDGFRMREAEAGPESKVADASRSKPARAAKTDSKEKPPTAKERGVVGRLNFDAPVPSAGTVVPMPPRSTTRAGAIKAPAEKKRGRPAGARDKKPRVLRGQTVEGGQAAE